MTNTNILNAIAEEYGVKAQTIEYVSVWEPEVFNLIIKDDPRVWSAVSFESMANYPTLEDLADAYGYDSFEDMENDYYVSADAGLNGFYLLVE